MLERVHVILDKLAFCPNRARDWPPFRLAGRAALAQPGRSCQAECAARGLLCERSFFRRLNSPAALAAFNCSVAPALAQPFQPSQCALQADPYLFSCASEPPADVRRLCPCRTFEPRQTLLCLGCSP